MSAYQMITLRRIPPCSDAGPSDLNGYHELDIPLAFIYLLETRLLHCNSFKLSKNIVHALFVKVEYEEVTVV
jgi:hypothetical protein